MRQRPAVADSLALKPDRAADLPAWQRGYPIKRLREFAAVFKERQKPLVFGAFGLTKERDIAEALFKDAQIGRHGIMWTGRPPSAVAIFSRTKMFTPHEDFAQRQYVMPAEVIYVRAFACLDPDSGRHVLRKLADAAYSPVILEIFEEDGTARAAIEGLGKYQTTKVMAGSEIKGVYAIGLDDRIDTDGDGGYRRYPDLPERLVAELPPAEQATLEVIGPFMSGNECAAIRDELAAFGDRWAQHYSSYNKRKSWTAFALRGFDPADPGFIIKPAEMAKGWQAENPERMSAVCANTTASEAFPAVWKILDRLPCKMERVRFMRLAPGKGELTRHADITNRDAGVQDGKLARLHIPIQTNEQVEFVAWDARGERLAKHLPECHLCYLDQRKPHAVVNRGPVERIHLVIDAWSTPQLRRLIAGE